MIHWFMKPGFAKVSAEARRGRRGALLFAVPVMALAFILLNTAFSTQSSEQAGDSDNDGMSDAYEIFFGLNPANPVDVLLDYDGDALTNLAESVKLTDPFCEDTDRDGFSDDLDEKISRAYIQWGNPQFTTGDQYEYAHPDWFLGAYKNGGEWVVFDKSGWPSSSVATASSGWRVSGTESNNVISLNIDLDRTILTNNLRYAIHYRAIADPPAADSVGSNISLFVDLLDTNGAVVAENLYGNLLSVSNVAGYAVIPAEAGIQSNNVVLLNIPTEKHPAAAVIQLKVDRALPASPERYAEASRARSSGEEIVTVYEGLLYIDEDGDGLDADQEKQIGTSDYCIDSNGNGTNDYDECFNSGSSTNNPDDVPPPPPPSPGDDDKDKGIIYVDQSIGDDQLTGRFHEVSGTRGPKKTVRGGLSIVETNDTIIIRSGTYNENLNIQGKDLKVFIEGSVKL